MDRNLSPPGNVEGVRMRGEIIYEYQTLNSEDQKAFRHWLWANTVVGAVLLMGMIVLAIEVPGDQSATTAENVTMHMQAKLAPERAPALPSH